VPSGGGPVWYELRFAARVQRILFQRAALIAGPSGVTHSAWKASAYDGAGHVVATAQEDEIRSSTKVPAARFQLSGQGITQLRFEADNHQFDGFANLVLPSLPI
jgi:hypothetical protein